jgi:hypothetical protein
MDDLPGRARSLDLIAGDGVSASSPGIRESQPCRRRDGNFQDAVVWATARATRRLRRTLLAASARPCTALGGRMGTAGRRMDWAPKGVRWLVALAMYGVVNWEQNLSNMDS